MNPPFESGQYSAYEEVYFVMGESLEKLKQEIINDTDMPSFLAAREDLFQRAHRESDKPDLEGFRAMFKTHFDAYKYRRIQHQILDEIRNEDKLVDIDRLEGVNTILEKFGIRFPNEILETEPGLIASFASEYSKIVKIPVPKLMRSWNQIHEEQSEWDKLARLLDSDESAEGIYQSLETGGSSA